MAKRTTDTTSPEVETVSPAAPEVEAAPVGDASASDSETEAGATEASDASGDDANGSAPPAPKLSVKERITLGGRGEKKDADGKITAPAEPTVLVYAGTIDLSALADPANAEHIRNIAALAIIDTVSKDLRAKVRAGMVIPETGFTAEQVAAAVSEAITTAVDPFAAKIAKERAAGVTNAKLKAEVATKTDKLADLQALAVACAEAKAAGDTAKAEELQAQLITRASQP